MTSDDKQRWLRERREARYKEEQERQAAEKRGATAYEKRMIELGKRVAVPFSKTTKPKAKKK
jgi:hypothetical protein